MENRSLSRSDAPVDVLLNRGHPIPIPYLTSPSLSFLIDLTPRAYLSIIRHEQNCQAPTTSSTEKPLDISLDSIRSFMTTQLEREPKATFSIFRNPSDHLFSHAKLSLVTTKAPFWHNGESIPEASPQYPLIHNPPNPTPIDGDASVMVEDIPEVIRTLTSHVLAAHDGEQWMLDFGTCSVGGIDNHQHDVYPSSSSASPSSSPSLTFPDATCNGILIRQSAMLKISQIVGLRPQHHFGAHGLMMPHETMASDLFIDRSKWFDRLVSSCFDL